MNRRARGLCPRGPGAPSKIHCPLPLLTLVHPAAGRPSLQEQRDPCSVCSVSPNSNSLQNHGTVSQPGYQRGHRPSASLGFPQVYLCSCVCVSACARMHTCEYFIRPRFIPRVGVCICHHLQGTEPFTHHQENHSRRPLKATPTSLLVTPPHPP